MLNGKLHKYSPIAVAALLALIAPASRGQGIVSEDFTNAATSNPWYFFNGACLTASSTAATTSPGPIPSCISIASSYYNETLVGGNSGYLGGTSAPGSPTAGTPDPVGQG